MKHSRATQSSRTAIITASLLALSSMCLLHAKHRIHLRTGYNLRQAQLAQQEQEAQEEAIAKQYQPPKEKFYYVQTPSGEWQAIAIDDAAPHAIASGQAATPQENAYFDVAATKPADAMVRGGTAHNTATTFQPAQPARYAVATGQGQPAPTIIRRARPVAVQQPTFGQKLAAMGDGQLVDALSTDKPLQLQQLSTQERGQLNNRLKSLVDRLNQRLAQIQAYDAAAPQ